MMFVVFDRLTKERANIEEIVSREKWAQCLRSLDLEGFAVAEDGSLILLDECGHHVYCPLGRFRVVLRAGGGFDTPSMELTATQPAEDGSYG